MKFAFLSKGKLIRQFSQKPQLGSLRYATKNAIPNLVEQALNNMCIERKVLRPRYRAYLDRHQVYRRSLLDKDQVIVSQLQKTGLYITTLAELKIPKHKVFFQAGKQLFQMLENQASSTLDKFQVTPDFSLLETHGDVFQWGLTERLLAIAENYIGLPIAYDTCLCNISVNNGVETATRRWHLDNEDRRVLKIIIYFNDVDLGGGPFQALDPDSSRQVLTGAGDRCAFFSSQAFDALVRSQVSVATPQTCTGPTGTVIFVDTAKVYHRGQPPTEKSRQAITFGYCSRRPQRPFRCGRNQLDRHQLEQLSVGLSDEQKACIFWQDELPLWVRLIPTYSYG